jgi:hypothetical protein
MNLIRIREEEEVPVKRLSVLLSKLKIRTMEVLTVKEAVERINKGGHL